MLSDLTSQILSKVNTKTEALGVLRDWEQAIVADRAFPQELKNFLSKSNYEAEFEKTKQVIRNIEPLYLYLPTVLQQEELTKIVADLRREHGQEFLVEVKITSDLIGGCAMSYKGVYKDYSIRSKIAKNWETIKKELIKSV